MKELAQTLRDLEENKVYEIVEKQLTGGVSPLEIIKDCNDGMVAVGELFSQNKYFISQLIFSSEILKNVMKRIEPLLEGRETTGNQGKVVIGTVKGDIHDIGKDIVITLLKGSGFEVVDLGVDVPAEKFVDAVKQTGAKVLGLSALLNFTYPEMKTVVDAVTEAGLREPVKIILGGAPVDEKVRVFARADFVAKDAVEGLEICKKVYA
jgi:methanogenic corrinoid protein MtbC1